MKPAFGDDAGVRVEPSVDIQVPAEGAIAQVGDEQRGGIGIVATDDVVNRARAVLDRAHQIELVLGGVKLGEVGQHLEQPERQHDRSIRPLFVNHIDGDVAGRADAAQPDGTGVETPVLRKRRRGQGYLEAYE